MTRRKERKLKRKKKPRVHPSIKPVGYVTADLDKQVPNNSYSSPPLYYVDKTFKCRECGTEEVWYAEEQKVWYEEYKGSLYSTAVRCFKCRRERRERRRRSIEGMPNKEKELRNRNHD